MSGSPSTALLHFAWPVFLPPSLFLTGALALCAVVQADLRKDESLMQLFDSLEYLDVVVNDVFNRVSHQVSYAHQLGCELVTAHPGPPHSQSWCSSGWGKPRATGQREQ